MMNTITSLPPRQTFMRVGRKSYVNGLIKEARRVGYTVAPMGSADFVWGYTVTDPTNAEAKVFKAVALDKSTWAITYHTPYFQENE